MSWITNFFDGFNKNKQTTQSHEQPIVITASSTSTQTPIINSVKWDPNLTPNLKGSFGVITLKPAPLIVPFTNSLDYLDPKMRKDFVPFMRKVDDAKLKIGISCTARLMKCQVALYAQGRQPLVEINRLRLLAGMKEIGATEAKKIVTWTLFSKHLVNYDDEDPNNDYSQAFDFFLLSGKTATWDVKTNVNKNKILDYEEIGEIAESFGWVWGGRWKKKPDYPHIEMGS